MATSVSGNEIHRQFQFNMQILTIIQTVKFCGESLFKTIIGAALENLPD